MSDVVFILGAGTSKQAGAPLMVGFLDRARSLQREGDLGHGLGGAFDLVFKARDALQAAQSKAALDIDNLESVFAAFEMAKLTGRLSPLAPEEVAQLPEAMRSLIAATIERSIRLRVAGNSINPPLPHDEFAKLLGRMTRESIVAVITFNYDLCLDYALLANGVRFSYGLGEANMRSGVRLLKLHGSLNWVWCSDCGIVTEYGLHQYFERKTFPGAESVRLLVSEEATRKAKCRGCGKAGGQLMVVPPTWNKASHQAQLSQIWSAAAAELQHAERIMVCGYSLPPSDHFFHYLYALGTIGSASLREFRVCDPDGDVEGRFDRILGQQARGRFASFRESFQEMINRAKSLIPQTA